MLFDIKEKKVDGKCFFNNVTTQAGLLCVFLMLSFAASALARDVSFSWTPNNDDPPVDGYRLYYKIGDPGAALADYTGTDADGLNPSPIEIAGQASSSYTIANLLDEEQYSFVLTAFRGSEESSPTDAVILAASSGSSQTAETRSLSFTWTANTDDPPVDGYRLYYKTGDPGSSLADYNGTDADNANPAPIEILGQSTTSYTLTNLETNQQYSFVLTSFRDTQESDPTEPLVVDPLNSAPVASSASINATEDTVYTGQLSASDADGDALTYTITANGTRGAATITDVATGAFTYTPSPNEYGSDAFSFRVNDGSLDSADATVDVTIAGVNDAPTAEGSSISVTEDITYTGQLTGTDPEGDALTYNVASNAANGVVTITNVATGAFSYAPGADVTGSDAFTFRVNDGALNSAAATINIAIASVNDRPVANGFSFSTAEDEAYTGQLSASDPDGDSLTYSIGAGASSGAVTITNTSTGAFTYTPDPNISGSDSFTFRVNDGTENSFDGMVDITITAVNDAPVATEAAYVTDEDTIYSGQLSGTDSDGDSLTYSIAANGAKGTASVNAATGAFTYTPNANENGVDTFTFIVNDGTVNSAEAAVDFTIAPVNDAPVVSSLSFSTEENTAYSGQLTAEDVDGDDLTYSIVTNGTKGTANVDAASGAFTYTPNTDESGTDSFTFIVNDGRVNSTQATVSANITSVNVAPVASSLSFTTEEDTEYSGQLPAEDADGDDLTYSLTSNGSKGTATITDSATGTFTYTPNAGESGSDTFTFVVNDGTVNSGEATVSVDITGANEAPIANDTSFSTLEEIAYSGELSATDPDADTLTYVLVSDGDKGSVTIDDPQTGAFTYTPAKGKKGTDSFTFKVNDGELDSANATVSITIYNAKTKTALFGDTPDADYTGTLADTYTMLNSEVSETKENLNLWSWSASTPHKVANTIILKADLTAIPSYAKVVEAKLELYQTEVYGASDYQTSVHKITGKDPVISQVNGYNAYNGEPWSSVPAGTTYDNIPLGLADIDAAEDTVTVGSASGYTTWMITNMVQEWVKTPSANYGLLIQGVETSVETGRFFAASENQTAEIRPRLTILYSTAPAPPKLIIIEEKK